MSYAVKADTDIKQLSEGNHWAYYVKMGEFGANNQPMLYVIGIEALCPSYVKNQEIFMNKFEYARYLRKELRENREGRETHAHNQRVKLVKEASTSTPQGRKSYANGVQTSGSEKIAIMLTPVKVRVGLEVGQITNKYANIGVSPKCTLMKTSDPTYGWATTRHN